MLTASVLSIDVVVKEAARCMFSTLRRGRRSLSEELPETVAAVCWAFISGPVAEDPH